MSEHCPPAGADPARLLSVLSHALEVLLGPDPLETNLARAIALVGSAAKADRTYVFRGLGLNGDIDRVQQTVEWVQAGITPQIDNPILADFPLRETFPRWYGELSRGRAVFGLVAAFPAHEREILRAQDIQSIAIVPVTRAGRVTGFIGFDACTRERTWNETEIHVLRALAAGIGGAVAQRLTEAALAARAEDLKRNQRVALSLMEDAQAAERQAAAANDAKSQFLAVMSHEMRTPLNGILGFAELLAETPDPTQREYAETIASSGRLLLSLITDLLDFAKIEAGRIDLDLSTGSLREPVERVAATFARTASHRGVPLHVELAPDLPAAVRTDFLRYEQVLLNLVGNAMKFTARGAVNLTVTAERAPNPGDLRIVTEVRDTGPGIPADAFERIFEPFAQAHSSVHQQFGGSGLGLAICRRLARLLGGDITLTSEPGRGSCFRFVVPMTAESAPATQPAGPPDPSATPATSSIRVLVVDDVATNRSVASAFLRRLSCEVILAGDGDEAVQAAAVHQPRLILMDVLMPGTDGLAATRAIRAAPAASGQPWIAALSADATTENERRCREAGMDFFLTKPIRRDALAEVVARAAAENRATA